MLKMSSSNVSYVDGKQVMTVPELLRKYGWHLAGCGVWPDNDQQWPDHESYLSDKRCTCGLRELIFD